MVSVSRLSGGRTYHKYETLGAFASEYDANLFLGEAEERCNKFDNGLQVRVNIYKSEANATIRGTIISRRVVLESEAEWCPVMYTVDLDPGQLPGSPGVDLRKICRKVLRGSVQGTTSRVELSRDLITPDDLMLDPPDQFVVFPLTRGPKESCPKVIWLSHFEMSDREAGGNNKGAFYSWDTMQQKSASEANKDAERLFDAFLSGVRQRPNGAMLTQVASTFLWEGGFPETHRSRFYRSSWRFTQRTCPDAPQMCYSKAKHNGFFIGMFRDMVNDDECLHWAEKHVVKKASNPARSLLRKRPANAENTKTRTKVMKAK